MKHQGSLSEPRIRRFAYPRLRHTGTPISEAMAAFMGTTGFIYWMAAVLVTWVLWNTLLPSTLRFDPYPFQFLTLMLSVQASFSAPLILLAQYKQEATDRAQAQLDRSKLDQSRADTDFLARELMDVRTSVTGMATRQYISKELERVEERLLASIQTLAGAVREDEKGTL